MMNSFRQICVTSLTLLLTLSTSIAFAFDGEQPILLAQSACASKAQSLASSYPNARIVTVNQSGNTCEVVIEVPASGGTQPRILRKKIPAG